MYDLLQKPFTLKCLKLKNHLVMSPMGINLGAPDGGVTDELLAFYEARARGGVGLIISEVTRIEGGPGISDPCQMASYRPSDVAGIQRLADMLHRYGTRLFIQLQHPGRAASSLIAGTQPVAPSAVASPMGGELPRALTEEECDELVMRFVNAARIAQMGGADGVELHAAHGYLINQFISPAMNMRTDGYGGSFEKRMRFAVDILRGIRQQCGSGFPVSVRINAEESLPGGIDIAQAQQIAAVLEKNGADLINVSCYTEGCIEPGTYPQGWKRHMAQAIKQAVSIPVLAVCNIKGPQIAEDLLNEGVCDLIGLGRALLADPEWPRKAFSGRESEIRTCIGCLSCFQEICKLRSIRCAVNPCAGREREYSSLPSRGEGQTVAVVGGGPAGMQAALVLKKRGFYPVLIEKAGKLGGALNIADQGYGKEKITSLVAALSRQIEAAGIKTCLGQPATVESLQALQPHAVVIACGAEPLLPQIPGIDSAHVMTAESVLMGVTHPTGSVAVIGSGMTGLETAEMLAMAGCNVTIVEMMDTLGGGAYPSVVSDIMSRLLPYRPQILTGHKLISVLDKSVELQRLSDLQAVFVPADQVVLAMGVRPRRALAAACEKLFPHMIVIGDASQPGRVLEAMQDAQGASFSLELDND